MNALTKTQAIIIIIAILIIVAGAVLYYYTYTPPTTTTPPPTTTTTATTTTTTTTPVATTTPTTTTPTVPVITIGNSTIRVSSDLYDFVQACKSGSIPKGSVEIIFGHALASSEIPAFQQAINSFMQEYPCIKVTVKAYADMNTLKSSVIAAVAVGQPGAGPDVFTWAHDWIGSFAEAGRIVALDKYLPPESIQDIRSLLLPVAASAVTYKLKMYGVPYAGEAIALIINKKMVSTPPKTFDEMKAIMQQFYNPSQEKYGLAYQIDPYHIYPWITAFGGYWYDQLTDTIGVNSTQTKEGVIFFIKNILPYLYYQDLGAPTQPNLFFNGQAPMIITGPWNLAGINQSIGLDNIIVEAIPPIIINGTEHIPRPFSGFRNMYITTLAELGGKNRILASILFVLYMGLNDDVLKTLMIQNGYVPVKLSVLQYLEANKDKYPIIYGFAQSVMNSTPMPNSPKMDVVWNVGTYLNAIINAYTQAMSQGKPQSEAIQAAIAQVGPQLDQAYASIMQALSTMT
ncbi:extracellular solute-binding protein [Thermogladius sp. 4427co]|uniref:extracellular solute-binding protein n=1 Tax=Thermogladius sp. 4427co TaxID=3450718 RepID=UPI003F7AD7BB